jgi:hypothetical protein
MCIMQELYGRDVLILIHNTEDSSKLELCEATLEVERTGKLKKWFLSN